MSTIDGKVYTFNGLGDYTLVTVTDDAIGFVLQGRTSKAKVNESFGIAQSKATVFSGFAVKEKDQAHIEIYLNVTCKYSTFTVIFCAGLSLVFSARPIENATRL